MRFFKFLLGFLLFSVSVCHAENFRVYLAKSTYETNLAIDLDSIEHIDNLILYRTRSDSNYDHRVLLQEIVADCAGKLRGRRFNHENVHDVSLYSVFPGTATQTEFNAACGIKQDTAFDPSPMLAKTNKPSKNIPPPIPFNGSIVKIGHAAPLTGVLSPLGRGNENGARLAIEELNAANLLIGGQHVRFELDSKDDRADPQTALQVARELVADHVSGVIGHLTSGTTIPASPIYADAGIVQISSSATNPAYTEQGFATAFRVTANNRSMVALLARYVNDSLHPVHILVIDDGTAYGSLVATVFSQQMQAYGVNVMDHLIVHAQQRDFSAEIQKARKLHPDVVVYGGVDKEAGALLTALHNARLDPVLVGSDGICTANLATLADRVDKVICEESNAVMPEFATSLDAFKETYEARFLAPVQAYSAINYDAVKLMVEAMKKADSTDPKIYRNAFSSIQYKGVSGNYQFAANGDLLYPRITLFGYQNKQKYIRAAVDGQAQVRSAIVPAFAVNSSANSSVNSAANIKTDTMAVRKTVIDSSTESDAYAAYYVNTQTKIEKIGSLNFPRKNGKLLYGKLEVSIPIAEDGSLYTKEGGPAIVKTSGSADLDMAALHIVRMAAPFLPIPAAMRLPGEKQVFVVIHQFDFSPE